MNINLLKNTKGNIQHKHVKVKQIQGVHILIHEFIKMSLQRLAQTVKYIIYAGT
ncbi:MAG: hypothetical protein UT66_C0002G0015 [candidate division CPR2 bacterium GW2011_GWC1_39_9]|nr:MAG: hypothetical protein UT66_C0002G0015 [candidate division CPR2 bacterium GW2011_GWC1_39_9]